LMRVLAAFFIVCTGACAAGTSASGGGGEGDRPVSSAKDRDRAGDVGLVGRVTTPEGSPVTGALIVPRSLEGKPVPELAVTTDDSGRYGWPLGPGRYEITASARGYRPTTQGVTVTEEKTTLDLVLTPR
jgi:Carboxypeptidase regulatory-like domain